MGDCNIGGGLGAATTSVSDKKPFIAPYFACITINISDELLP